MTINVRLDRTDIAIDDAVFTILLDNSVAGTYADYRHALESGTITFSDLVSLARKGDIPYSLFFAPLSDEFKVTPSAVTVRAMRLGLVDAGTARSYLDELRIEFERRPRSGPRQQIKPENAVRKYNGRELSVRMLEILDAGHLTPREFCRAVCLNHIKPDQIGNLRVAVS